MPIRRGVRSAAPQPSGPAARNHPAALRAVVTRVFAAVFATLAVTAVLLLWSSNTSQAQAYTGAARGGVCPSIGATATSYYGEKFLCVQGEDSQPRWQHTESSCSKCWTCPGKCSPSPSTSSSPSPSLSPSVSPTPSVSQSPSPSPSLTGSPTPTATATASPSPSVTDVPPTDIPPGDGELPLTGAPAGQLLLAGLLIVVGGVGLIGVARVWRSRQTA